MSERIRLGVILNYSTKWMGGIIYILNLIRTMNRLPDEQKPQITLFYNKNLKRFLNEIEYPYIQYIEWPFPAAYKAYFFSWILRKNLFVRDIIHKFELDALYPVHDFPVKTKTNVRLIAWYADLQHKHYPEFFLLRKRIERDFRNRLMLRHCDRLVLSSQAVADDFNTFYAKALKAPVSIYHFVSIIEQSILLDDHKGLCEKYGLPEKYFFVSNQFAKHKNHIIVLQALSHLCAEGEQVHIAFTGKLPDRQTSKYIAMIYDLIEKHEMAGNVSFLGLLPRPEQVSLMKNAISVIQPSLFEGWSTVNEDALALEVPVIASNIPVNVEQLGNKGVYFDPADAKQLAFLIKKNFHEQREFEFDYEKRIESALDKIREIFISTS